MARDGSMEWWCAGSLQVACWHDEVAEICFALDCCDRECLAFAAEPRALAAADIRRLMHDAAAARFGEARPLAPVQGLSDNGGIYTALATLICAEGLTRPRPHHQAGIPPRAGGHGGILRAYAQARLHQRH